VPDAPSCARCGGTPHLTRFGTPACTAHGKRTGRPCTNPPMHGQTVCKMHGGNARQNRAAGARRKAEAEAAKAVATLGLPVDISPTEALLEEVRWTAGHVAWLRGKVQELTTEVDTIVEPEEDDGERELMSRHPNHARHGLVWGTKQVTDKRSGQEPGIDTVEAAAPSIWYELYARERAHLVKVCEAAIKAGVEERRVRLAESQGQLVAMVIGRILDALQLSPAQLELVPVIVPRELRAIAAD
jgi:hypothetical protein